MSAWSKWTSCSKPCGFGESQRARNVKTEADHGGIPCPVLQATKSCNDFHCPVNCTVKQLKSKEGKALENLPRSALGVNGAAVPNLAIGEILDKLGGEGTF